MAKFDSTCSNYHAKQNLYNREITDFKTVKSLRVFFALNSEVQALWYVYLPVRVSGVKQDGTAYDFVMSKEYIHPGININDTEQIPEDKMCSWTQLYKYLKDNDNINDEEVILQVGEMTYRKAQILGKWENPNDTRKNDFKYNIQKPHGMFYKCHHWLFPVIDTRDQSMLKVVKLPYSLGGAIFDKVQEGIAEEGDEADPMKKPHLYQLMYQPEESNPQKKYKVMRYKQEIPTQQTLDILKEELDTRFFVKPLDPKIVNRIIYDALIDKSLWDKIENNLLDEAKGIFDGDEEELKIKLGIAKRNKEEKDNNSARTRHGDVNTSTKPVEPPQTGNYWMYINNNTVQKTAEEVQAEVDSGNENVPTMLVGESEWKKPSDYGFVSTPKMPTPPSAPPAPPSAPSAPSQPRRPKFGSSGQQANVAPPQQQTSTNNEDETTYTCQCGKKISILDEVCPDCGSPVDDIPF